MSTSNIIAVLCDFDDTLGNDTTNLFLKRIVGLSDTQVNNFWNNEVRGLISKGWDPPLAYINKILNELRTRQITVTNQDLRALGKQVELFPGVTDVFPRLKSFIRARPEFLDAHIEIEFFIISGGFEEVIRGTSLLNEVTEVFGCTFDETPEGGLLPKSIVTFTEKTKFLYAINKGIRGAELRRNPYSVNEVIPKDKRRIPFTNMIYIGDGPTDIPCFSAIQQNGGKTVGVLKYQKKADEVIVDNIRSWAVARGDRVTLGPYRPNYRDDSDLFVNLRMQIEIVGLDIVDRLRRKGPSD